VRRYVDIFILNNAAIMVQQNGELSVQSAIPGRT